MKTIYLLITIFLTNSIYSQTNFLPADSTVIWTGATTFYGGGPQAVYHYWTQFGIDSTENDTLINSQYYTKLNYFINPDSSSYFCGFRADTTNQTLYFLPKDSINEYMFFDYNIEYELEDTVFIPHYENGSNQTQQDLGFQYYRLHSIDSLLIGTDYYKLYGFNFLNISDSLTSQQTYNLTDLIYVTERTISGRSFPFHGIENITVSGSSTLYCYQENGSFKYETSYSSYCPLLPDNYLFSSIENQESLRTVSIYPNPSSGTFSIEVNDADESILTVYDLSGKAVHNTSANSQLINLDLSHLKSGIYILEVSSEGTTVNKKLIIK